MGGPLAVEWESRALMVNRPGGGCTVRDLDSMSETKGDRGGWWDTVTEGKVKCVRD